jgi:enoyl-CoA hydratase/carnithine racemase
VLAEPTHDGPLAVLTVDNPPHNLFDLELIDELIAAVYRLENTGTRALLIEVNGPNFSGGANVRIFKDQSAAPAREVFARALPMIARIEELPFPTVAAVRGLCLAAGLELILACDLIMASDNAQFAQVEAAIGTSTLLGGVQRLSERAGPARAREITYTADLYSAGQFERWNIVNRVVVDADLDAEARAFALRLANGPTLAHACTKRLVREHLDTGTRNADRLIMDVATPLFETADMQGGVATLLEHGARHVRERTTFTGH